MIKWYEDPIMEEGVILSSRIRLARNIEKYNFPPKLSRADAELMIEDTSVAIHKSVFSKSIQLVDFDGINPLEEHAMVSKHVISKEFLCSTNKKAVLLKDDETVSIMLNEEDHIRLQVIAPGDQMDQAYGLADKLDDLMEECLEFAFDNDLGYLTSCPTNVGTGLRGSYMVHIPLLELSGQLNGIFETIAKFGMTVRGIYGEGSQALGGIYQISNQLTMGKTELEMLDGLKNVVRQIVERETYLREQSTKNSRIKMEDKVYRAYGIVSNARTISGAEAIALLSDVRVGSLSGLLKKEGRPCNNLYQVMINCQAGMIQLNNKREMNEPERNVARAEYLRKCFAN